MSEDKNLETLRARNQYWLDNRWWYLLIVLLVAITSWLANMKTILFNDPPTQDVIVDQSDRSTKINTTIVTPEVTKKDVVAPPEKPVTRTGNTVSGYVYDEDGNPVENVKVNVPELNEKVVTNEDGRFTFNFQKPPENNFYTLTFIKKGYENTPVNCYEVPKQNIAVSLKKQQP